MWADQLEEMDRGEEMDREKGVDRGEGLAHREVKATAKPRQQIGKGRDRDKPAMSDAVCTNSDGG